MKMPEIIGYKVWVSIEAEYSDGSHEDITELPECLGFFDTEADAVEFVNDLLPLD